jgi:hypothetical protein
MDLFFNIFNKYRFFRYIIRYFEVFFIFCSDDINGLGYITEKYLWNYKYKTNYIRTRYNDF